MINESALAIIAKYAPCPHESYDDTLGNGKVWARCLDCGVEFKQEHHGNYQKAATEFQNAMDVLTRATQEETVNADKLYELLDDMNIPNENDDGHTLDIEERLQELKCKWAEMKARDEVYGYKNPQEELLRLQRALLSRPHTDYLPVLFVRDVCELFGFTVVPSVPDDLWYRSALVVIRNRLSS